VFNVLQRALEASNEFLLSGAYSSKNKRYVKLFLPFLQKLYFLCLKKQLQPYF